MSDPALEHDAAPTVAVGNSAAKDDARDLDRLKPGSGDPWTKPLAIATIVLAIATVILVITTVEAIRAQQDDSRQLLGAQISNELSKEFDSPAMRCSRQSLANLVLHNKPTHDWRVLDFLDKVAMHARRRDLLDEDAYQEFSYWLERWWLAMRNDVRNWRSQQNAPDYYEDLEQLYSHMRDLDHSAEPSAEEVQRFLTEEEGLDTFDACRRPSKASL